MAKLATTPLHLDTFIAKLNEGIEFADVNRWIIEFPLLSVDKTNIISSNNHLSLMCENISFPGKTLLTNELSRTYGPYTKMPYAYLYNDVMMTLKCTSDMKEKTFFSDWQELAIPKNNECRFYYDYVADIKIHQLNRAGKIKHTVILNEAYPSAITEVPLDYNTENTYNRLNITMTFFSWRVEDQNTNTNNGTNNRFINPNPVGVSPEGIIRDAAGGDFTTV